MWKGFWNNHTVSEDFFLRYNRKREKRPWDWKRNRKGKGNFATIIFSRFFSHVLHPGTDMILIVPNCPLSVFWLKPLSCSSSGLALPNTRVFLQNAPPDSCLVLSDPEEEFWIWYPIMDFTFLDLSSRFFSPCTLIAPAAFCCKKFYILSMLKEETFPVFKHSLS